MIIVWIKQHRRSALLVGATLLVPAYLILSAIFTLLSLRAGYVEDIETIEPRIARMQGLVDNQERLRKQFVQVRNIVGDHVYPVSTDAATIAAALQAEARNILGGAGMEITNSQVLPNRKRDSFDYVAVKVVARGTLPQLDESLTSFGGFRPVILVESMEAFPNRRRSRKKDQPTEQIMTVSLQIMSVRSAT